MWTCLSTITYIYKYSISDFEKLLVYCLIYDKYKEHFCEYLTESGAIIALQMK